MLASLTMELAIGAIDGVNREFASSRYYVGGSVRAFSPILQSENQVTELGGNRIELAEAPLEGDVIYLLYRGV